MKIIFLDFDGVLNTVAYQRYIYKNELQEVDNKGRAIFDPACINNLRKIIVATGADIVVSSDWKYIDTYKDLLQMWEDRDLPGFLTDTTPNVSRHRGDEIDQWLKDCKEECDYVILDDLSKENFNTHQLSKFIHIEPFKGITDEHVTKAIEILNHKKDKFNMKNIEDKIKGCIIGGAIGDALGYPVEFVYSFHDILRKYGEKGIVNYDLEYDWIDDEINKAQVSDDTQMTLYTLEALIQKADSIREIIQNVTDAYLVWMSFQTGENVMVDDIYKTSKIPELNQRRAPGNTCLSALASINRGRKVVNDSKGCGGIMRVAPVGIYGALKGWDLEHTAEIAGKIAEITHKHPLSTYSSAACAVLIQLCLLEDEIDKKYFISMVKHSMKIIKEVYGITPEMQSFDAYINETLSLTESPEKDLKIIEHKIGEGWVAEESFAIAIFCVARHIDNFKDGIVAAVNHGGDSDSTGAIAGNIIGAILGYEAIPEQYKKDLQNLEFIEELSEEISEVQ